MGLLLGLINKRGRRERAWTLHLGGDWGEMICGRSWLFDCLMPLHGEGEGVGDGWEDAGGGENVGVEGYQERSKLCIRTWVDSGIYKIDGGILPRNMQPLCQRTACCPGEMIGVEFPFASLLD